jgi:hypothetical protein
VERLTLSEKVWKEMPMSARSGMEQVPMSPRSAAEFFVLSDDDGEDASDSDFGCSPEQVDLAMLGVSKRGRVKTFFRTTPVVRLLTRTGRRNRAMREQREKMLALSRGESNVLQTS